MTRREWCAALAKLVSPAFPVEAQQALIDMLPALRHLPDALFTAETLGDVAMAKRRQTVPAFDEIVRALNEYRRTFLPDPTLRLAGPKVEPDEWTRPPPEEVKAVSEMLTSWRRERAAQVLAEEAEQRARRPEFRDVTLKGEHLRRSREARGIVVAAP